MVIQEKYQLFKRNGVVCRFGIWGLTLEYFLEGQSIPEPRFPAHFKIEIPPPKKRVMQAVITAKCNLSCKYCSFFANAPAGITEHMSNEELSALCERFNRELGAEGLLLITGGEPETYPDAVNYLVQNVKGKIILFTNGTLTTEARLSFYQKHQVGVLFSLDGDLFSHDTARLAKGGSHSRVARSLRLAKQMGFDFGISAVVGDHNIEKLPTLVEYFITEFQPASLGLNLPHKFDGDAWMRIEEYTTALMEIFPLAKREGLFIDQINRRLTPLINRQFRFRDCAAQGEKIVVFPGGVETSCVNEAGLKALAPNWAEQLPIHHPICQNCYAIGICGGGCIFDGSAIYGSGCFDLRNCYFSKQLLEFFIWEFYEELGEGAADQELLKERYQSLLQRREGTHFSIGHEPE
ncbi:MAG: radical SAM protein [bacterium]